MVRFPVISTKTIWNGINLYVSLSFIVFIISAPLFFLWPQPDIGRPLPISATKEAVRFVQELPEKTEVTIWPERYRPIEIIGDSHSSRLIEGIINQQSIVFHSWLARSFRTLHVIDKSTDYKTKKLIRSPNSERITMKLGGQTEPCGYFNFPSDRLGIYEGTIFYDGASGGLANEAIFECVKKSLALVNITGIYGISRSLSVEAAEAVVQAFYKCATDIENTLPNARKLSGVNINPSVKCAKEELLKDIRSGAEESRAG